MTSCLLLPACYYCLLLPACYCLLLPTLGVTSCLLKSSVDCLYSSDTLPWYVGAGSKDRSRRTWLT